MSGEHAKALLILHRIQKSAGDGARGFSIAQGLVLDEVEPNGITAFVGIAAQITEVVRQDKCVVILRVNHRLPANHFRQHGGASGGRVISQTDQLAPVSRQIDTRVLHHRQQDRIHKLRRGHSHREPAFEFSPLHKRENERHATALHFRVLTRQCGAVTLKLRKLRTPAETRIDRKSTRLNSSHSQISYAVFCLKKKKKKKKKKKRY